MPDLKLPRLPDRTPVKIGIIVSPDLSDALRQYLALYCATYDDPAATVSELIPAMLVAFLASDRVFSRGRRTPS